MDEKSALQIYEISRDDFEKLGRSTQEEAFIQTVIELLQGLDDKVVPPAQAEVIVAALKQRGIPYAYIAFAGEGHGFRKAENIKRALEAHLSFLAQVFGFEPADELEHIRIENLERVAH